MHTECALSVAVDFVCLLLRSRSYQHYGKNDQNGSENGQREITEYGDDDVGF